jgi:peptide/nickel transport system permease protein
VAGFLLRRVGQVIPTLLIISVLVFGLQQLMPGDPALILAGEERGDAEVLAQIRAELMLDRPLAEQYLHWLGRVVQGDFGFSWRIRLPVGELILDKLPVTFQLAAMSFVIGVLIGVPAGVLSAVWKDRPADWAINAVALFGISTPNFWLGIMLILLFSVQLGWLPPSGYVPLWEDPWQSLTTTLMPAFVLGTGVASVLMRHTRAAMLGALAQDYVRTARAKGLSERVVVAKHALRNALIPVVTLGAIEFGRLLAGAVLTEQIFTIPGFGKLVVDAVFNRDYPVVQGVVLATALIFVLLSLLADILYMLVNPRLRSVSA